MRHNFSHGQISWKQWNPLPLLFTRDTDSIMPWLLIAQKLIGKKGVEISHGKWLNKKDPISEYYKREPDPSQEKPQNWHHLYFWRIHGCGNVWCYPFATHEDHLTRITLLSLEMCIFSDPYVTPRAFSCKTKKKKREPTIWKMFVG
jgi:hypothetical protein